MGWGVWDTLSAGTFDPYRDESMKKIRVLVSLITDENDYQREQAASATAAARKLDVDLQVVYANGEAIAQTKQLLAAINSATERPDAIVVHPAGTAMLQVAKAATQKSIAWVVVNRGVDNLLPAGERSSAPMASLELDQTEVGRIQGRQFAELMPAGGKLFYIEGPGTEAVKQRRAGMQETLPSNIQVESARAKWTEDSGAQIMALRLKIKGDRPPDVQVIGCQNDTMAMGARKAVEALPPGPIRDQWLKVAFTGCDGLPATGQKWVQRGLLAATVLAPPLAGLAIEQVVKALTSGRPMAEHTLARPASYPALGSVGKPVAGARG